MKEFFTFLTACIILSIAHALTVAAGIALLILALMAAITQPRRFHAFVGSLALFGLALAKPAACVAALAAIGVVLVITSQRVRRARVATRRQPQFLLEYDARHGT